MDRLSVADIDMPVRKMRANAAASTQKRTQRQGAAPKRT
ncbi:hypothetical protein SC1_03370 [Sphingopyxis sp. C-1]|nr:hypothetical protein SC1_03370 [Sphingopyxis sp. C-1]